MYWEKVRVKKTIQCYRETLTLHQKLWKYPPTHPDWRTARETDEQTLGRWSLVGSSGTCSSHISGPGAAGPASATRTTRCQSRAQKTRPSGWKFPVWLRRTMRATAWRPGSSSPGCSEPQFEKQEQRQQQTRLAWWQTGELPRKLQLLEWGCWRSVTFTVPLTVCPETEQHKVSLHKVQMSHRQLGNTTTFYVLSAKLCQFHFRHMTRSHYHVVEFFLGFFFVTTLLKPMPEQTDTCTCKNKEIRNYYTLSAL